MKALIVGANGQLGRALVAAAPAGIAITACDSSALDITGRADVDTVIDAVLPDVVFNAAAYTAVDKAEKDEAAAMAVNGRAVGFLADAARRVRARLVHVSTDFVFDGTAAIPYATDAGPNPVNAYGRTKLAGERLAGGGALIVRTAWVYAPAGENFVRKILRKIREGKEIRVVADQIGTPTYAPDLAAALWALDGKRARGIYHYTDAGVASWYDFAVAIQEEAAAATLLDREISVMPVATADFPAAARRPPFSVLDTSATRAVLGRTPPHWRANLRRMIAAIAAEQ